MADRRIPLYDLKLSRPAIELVNRVLKSGWLTTGSVGSEFERQLAKTARVRYTAAVSSATHGLMAALETIGAGGGEIITTPFTFVATIEAIYRVGGIPIFADIDPVTLTIDPDEVGRKVTDKTRCIVPVDIAGHPCDYSRLAKVCDYYKLPMVADASHSLGALRGRKTPAQWADAAVYSFQATKNVTAAEGGCVATRHKIVRDRVKLLSLHALTSNAYQRRQAGKWDYDVVGVGMKANLSDVHAAIGLGQLSVFEANQARRSVLAHRYAERLRSLGEYLEVPKPAKGVTHAWHLYIIRLHLSHLRIGRNRFITELGKRGVECGVHYKPVFDMSYYAQQGHTAQYFPNAAYAGRRVVSLPMFPELSLRDVDYVCDQIHDVIQQFGH